MEKLKIELSGDASKIQEASKEGIEAIENFEKKVNSSLDNVDSKFEDAGKSVEKIGEGAKKATPSLNSLDGKTKNASNSSKELAGNLVNVADNLIEVDAGGQAASGAIGSVGAALGGPAGLITILGIAVGALITYVTKVTDTNAVNKSLASEIQNVTDILREYTDVIQGVTNARVQGEVSAQKELVNLGLLRDAAEDTTRSTTDRLKAVQQLQSEYPDYFGNLRTEEILTGGLSDVYNELTTSILNRAKATAATNLLVQNAERELLINQRLIAITEQLGKLKDAEQMREEINAAGARSGGAIFNPFDSISEARLEGEAEDLINELTRILGENLDLTEFLSDSGGLDLSKVTLKTSGELPPLPEALPLGIEIQTEGIINNPQDVTDGLKGELISPLTQGISEAEFELMAAMIRFDQNASALIENSLSNTFASIGSAIGDAIASGGNVIDAVGNTILAGVGNFLSSMGQMLVEYGTLAVLKGKLDLAILAGGPVAIGAGIAAIAVGIALSAAGAAISSAATNQGIPTSGSGSTGGSTVRQAPISTSGGGLNGTVVFEIAGTKLVGVLNRTLNRNLAIGG